MRCGYSAALTATRQHVLISGPSISVNAPSARQHIHFHSLTLKTGKAEWQKANVTGTTVDGRSKRKKDKKDKSLTSSSSLARGEMPEARFHHTAVYSRAHDCMFVFGGQGDGADVFGDIWSFDFRASLAFPHLSLSITRIAHRCDACSHTILIGTGKGEWQCWWHPHHNGSDSSGGKGHQKQQKKKDKEEHMPKARYGHFATCDDWGESMVIMGGFDRKTAFIGDVWQFHFRTPFIRVSSFRSGQYCGSPVFHNREAEVEEVVRAWDTAKRLRVQRWCLGRQQSDTDDVRR